MARKEKRLAKAERRARRKAEAQNRDPMEVAPIDFEAGPPTETPENE